MDQAATARLCLLQATAKCLSVYSLVVGPSPSQPRNISFPKAICHLERLSQSSMLAGLTSGDAALGWIMFWGSLLRSCHNKCHVFTIINYSLFALKITPVCANKQHFFKIFRGRTPGSPILVMTWPLSNCFLRPCRVNQGWSGVKLSLE